MFLSDIHEHENDEREKTMLSLRRSYHANF